MEEVPAVITRRAGHMLVIELNRPQVRNAIDTRLAVGLEAALGDLDSDDDLRVGVLAGLGAHFCSGMDLKAFAVEGAPRTIMRVLRKGCAKPLVAAIEGVALGGGLELALLADVIVAARDSRLGIPEVRVGLLAAGGALLRLPGRVPAAVASEMALTGEPLSASDARSFGLLNRVTEPGGALPEALLIAERIERNAPLALRSTKRLLQAGADLSADDYWAAQRPIADSVFRSSDARIGAQAFAERSTPVWQGR